MYIQHFENKYFHQLLGQSRAHISLEYNVTKILYTCSMADKRTRPPRKSRKIEARQGSRTNTLLVPISAEQISELQQNGTRDTMQQHIQSCISAAIPDITTSVIIALTPHGFIMPPTSLQLTTTIINHTPGQSEPVTQSPLMNTNIVYPPVRQQPIFTNTSIYTQVPSTNTLTRLPNQFTENGSVIQSNTTMHNALVQPVINTCILASNQQQNAVPTISMTNTTLYDFLNTTCTCSSSMLFFFKPSIAKPLALGVDPTINPLVPKPLSRFRKIMLLIKSKYLGYIKYKSGVVLGFSIVFRKILNVAYLLHREL